MRPSKPLAHVIGIVALIACLLLQPLGTQPAAAQVDPPNPTPATPGRFLNSPDLNPPDGNGPDGNSSDGNSPNGGQGQPVRMANGYWAILQRSDATLDAGGAAARLYQGGGPDAFGYTWTSNTPYDWVDVRRGGTEPPFSGWSRGQAAGPIPLPFAFPYYEKTYYQVWVAASGYLGFEPTAEWVGQPDYPLRRQPNAIVAPYASIFNLAATGETNRVFYKTGGKAPNRFFAAEWYKVDGGCCDYPGYPMTHNQFTFEVLIYESGDILFQTGEMKFAGGGWCASSGIEDPTGEDGLAITGMCGFPESHQAIRIVRPPAAARVRITQPEQSRLTAAGARETFPITIRNTGDRGADRFDVAVQSAWPAQIGGGALVNGASSAKQEAAAVTGVTVGPLAPGEEATLEIAVQTPWVVNVGDNNVAVVTVRSQVDAKVQTDAYLRTGIAAPFVQFLRDEWDSKSTLVQIEPGRARSSVLSLNASAGSVAIAALPGGRRLAVLPIWSDQVMAYELNVLPVDAAGNGVGAPRRLPPPADSAGKSVSYYSPMMAATTDGHVGLVWICVVSEKDRLGNLYNVYLTVLDAQGEVVTPATNISQNTTWADFSTDTITFLTTPSIAATRDNRFVVSWERGSPGTDLSSHYEVFYAVSNAAGERLRGPTRYAPEVAESTWFEHPQLVSLQNGQVALLHSTPTGIGGAVLDANGDVVNGPWQSGAIRSANFVAQQLSSGPLILAWPAFAWPQPQVQFATLDAESFALLTPPTPVTQLPSGVFPGSLSLVADAGDHATITWAGAAAGQRDEMKLAIVNGAGKLVMGPIGWQSAPKVSTWTSRFWTTANGHGAAQNQAQLPVSEGPAPTVVSPGFAAASSGGRVVVAFDVVNLGSQAAAVQVVAQLPPELRYLSAVPAPGVEASDAGGGQVVWDLPALGFQGLGRLALYAVAPVEAIGSQHPVTITASAGDVSQTQVVSVTISNLEYFPVVRAEP